MIRWKKARVGRPNARVESITPSWLRVDRATIFFRSCSTMADIPAISIVRVARRRRVGEKRGSVESRGWNRNRRNTPAVTRVEEWTRAETGVGAAIAAGSQLENGIWALFVIAARVKRETVVVVIGDERVLGIIQWP